MEKEIEKITDKKEIQNIINDLKQGTSTFMQTTDKINLFTN